MSSSISGSRPAAPHPKLESTRAPSDESAASSSAPQTSESRRAGNFGALGDLAGITRPRSPGPARPVLRPGDPQTLSNCPAAHPVRGVAPVSVDGVVSSPATAATAEPAGLFDTLKSAVELTFSPASRRKANDQALMAALGGKIKVSAAEPKHADEAAARAPVTMTIDLGAFRENFRAVRQLVPAHTDMAVVLKADAYGVGAGKLAAALEKEGCNQFFVATLDEALKLRKEVKPDSTVLVLGGPLEGTARQFYDHGIKPVLNSVEQVEEWNALGREVGKKLPAILQFDTGMSRAGIAPADRARVKEGSAALEFVDVQHVMSHLATAGEATLDENGARQPSESMEAQHQVFKAIQQEYPHAGGSLAASAALHIPEYQKQLVRAGGVIHGQEIFDDGEGTHAQPVTVTGRLAEVREISAGEGIGYGLLYKAAEKKYIGTIPAGYADGLPRTLGGKQGVKGENVVNGHVKINGQPVDIVGKMSMDMTTVDLTHLLLGKMADSGGIGTDPDLRLWKRTDSGEIIPDKKLLSRAKVVFSDKSHTFDDVARESGLNSSMVQIGLGNSPRVRKKYVHREPSGAAPAGNIAQRLEASLRRQPETAIDPARDDLPGSAEQANG